MKVKTTSRERQHSILVGDLRLSGSVIRKNRFIFTKEQRTIRQNSRSLNYLNERIFQVNIHLRGWIDAS